MLFHDGSPFSAEDVVFSLKRARSPTAEMASYLKTVDKVEVIDEHNVRITTSVPNPLLPVELRIISIMSKSWAEKFDVVAPAEFKKGTRNFATVNANGTGPFKLDEFDHGSEVAMTNNSAWWGLTDYPHNVDRIVHKIVTDPDERLSLLLEAEIDFLFDPPISALEHLDATPNITLQQTTMFRTIFLGLDQGSVELGSSDIKGRNPFGDKRVRQAIYQGIDIKRIQRHVMKGLSHPAGMLVQPGVNGYSEELDQRLPHDLKAAKELLAQAGYGNGFSVELDCPNNRYINDEAICHEIASQLQEIGILVEVKARPKDQHFRGVYNRESDFYMQGWAAATQDSHIVFDHFFRQDGSRNFVGYASTEVERLIDLIGTEMITHARDAMIEEVWRLVLGDITYVPLHHQVIVWATRNNLFLPINPRNGPIFREARFR